MISQGNIPFFFGRLVMAGMHSMAPKCNQHCADTWDAGHDSAAMGCHESQIYGILWDGEIYTWLGSIYTW